MEKTNHTYNILFYLRRVKTDSRGNSPIYARITVNGKRSEFSISRSINSDRWDSNKQRAKGNREDTRSLNTYIDTVWSKLNDHHRQLIESNKNISALAIRNAYLGVTEKKLTLIELINYHNEQAEEKVNIDFAPATIKRYFTLLNQIKDFLKYKYRVEDISLSELNYKFISDYEHYLKTVRMCNNNSTVKYVRNLRKIVNVALANEWMQSDPFKKFKGSLEEVKRDFLSLEELTAIQEKHFTIPRLEQVRDIFVFSCFTGLSYIDVFRLTKDNIQIGIDGEKWIYTHRTKTDTKSNIPLLPAALEILDKYKEHPECKISGKLLPVISNQKLNSYLKEISDVCGIKKSLSFHCARHTFATTVTLTNGVPIETVSSMLGHKNIRTTQIYSKVIDKKVSEDMKVLKQRLIKKETTGVTKLQAVQK